MTSLDSVQTTPIGYRMVFHVDFPDEMLAQVACRTLSVDRPPKRSTVDQHFSVSGSSLVCQCFAPYSQDSTRDAAIQQLSKLRIAAHSVVDLACLVLETVETFK